MSLPSESGDELVVQTVAEPLHQILKQRAAGSDRGVDAAKPTLPKTRAFHPICRQPLATLTILDDGDHKAGEVIRIRDSRVLFGRDQGDVTIPFDTDISGQHAELRCQKQKDKYQWFLTDLGSTNGTFLRAYRATLPKKVEILLGSRRYAFHLPETPGGFDESETTETRLYKAPSSTLLQEYLPRLLEVGAAEDGNSFSIVKPSVLIGRDTACDLCVSNDPFLSPRHARFHVDERQRWMVEDRKSVNGVWLRIRRIPLKQAAEFQIGQQRFRFQPHVTAD